MEKKDLLSISELATISGVNAKSLRYYDRLGILRPAFVDPDTGYRYYAFYQKGQVDAIQVCVELGIPLKQFTNFTRNDKPEFQYGELFAYGSKLLTEKIKDLQMRLNRLQEWQTEIGRSEDSFARQEPGIYEMPSYSCWIVPYNGMQGCTDSQKLIKEVILKIRQNGLQQGYDYGLMLMRQNGQWKQFLFVDIDRRTPKAELDKHPEIVHIPPGQYLCKKVEQSGMDQVWDWCLPYVKEEQIQLVVESELFVGDYYFPAPLLEQRCLVI